jgi:O-antigen ligase
VLSNPFLLLFAGVFASGLLLGGGTKAGFLSDAIVQLAAIPLLLTALWRLAGRSSIRRLRWALAFCLAVVLLPLLQLVPLPPEIWTALPNREPVVAAFELLRRDLPWMPVSVSPHATALSALSLLPPVAIFLAMLSLDDRGRRAASLVVVGVGLLNVIVGLNQIAQGPSSPLRFYAYTNPTEAVGFFANRNHFAALLYCVTIVAAAWAVEAVRAFDAGGRRRDGRPIVSLAAAFAVLVALVAAQAMARSRAGLGLTMVALGGAFLLAFFDRRDTSSFTPGRLLVGTTAFAVMFASQFALYRIMERFSNDPLEDSRIVFARNTIEAAKAYMPFGSGMGTFVPVYGMFEKPQDVLLDAYVNRAHSDVIELWLESGVAGLVLMAVLVGWLAVASWKLWRRGGSAAVGVDLLLARAATLTIGLLAAHSFVDYPLRTTAMMSFMAFACGLLIAPPPSAGSEPPTDRSGTRRKKPSKRAATRAPEPAPRSPASVSPEPTVNAPGERWGQGIEWPEEWRSAGGPQASPRPLRPDEPPKKD